MKLLLLAMFCVGCVAEWDTVKFPHQNVQTGEIERKYVYWPPQHEMPPIVIPEHLNQH